MIQACRRLIIILQSLIGTTETQYFRLKLKKSTWYEILSQKRVPIHIIPI